jgi:hypothetical protein
MGKKLKGRALLNLRSGEMFGKKYWTGSAK